ncbi:unnamed protein product [Diplocarpon coronariae]
MVDGRWSLVADTEQSSRGGSRLLAGNRGNEGTGRQTPAAGVAGSDRSSRPPVWWREKMVARIVDYDMCILTDASPSSTIPRAGGGAGGGAGGRCRSSRPWQQVRGVETQAAGWLAVVARANSPVLSWRNLTSGRMVVRTWHHRSRRRRRRPRRPADEQTRRRADEQKHRGMQTVAPAPSLQEWPSRCQFQPTCAGGEGTVTSSPSECPPRQVRGRAGQGRAGLGKDKQNSAHRTLHGTAPRPRTSFAGGGSLQGEADDIVRRGKKRTAQEAGPTPDARRLSRRVGPAPDDPGALSARLPQPRPVAGAGNATPAVGLGLDRGMPFSGWHDMILQPVETCSRGCAATPNPPLPAPASDSRERGDAVGLATPGPWPGRRAATAPIFSSEVSPEAPHLI